MTLSLKDSWSIPGAWTIYYSNSEIITCTGILYFDPIDKLYLKLILETAFIKTKAVRDSIFHELSIDKIVGHTQKGTFFLFDSFSHNSSFGYTIVEYNILSNIACLVTSNLTIADKRIAVDDMPNENSELFHDGYIKYSNLFNWAYNNSRQGEDTDFYKKCELCDNHSLNNYHIEWVEFCLDSETTAKICIQYDSIGYTAGQDEIKHPNAVIHINSVNAKSIRFFTKIAWSIKNILSVFTGAYINIEHINLNKHFHKDEKYRERHEVFFPGYQHTERYTVDYPVGFRSKEELSLIFEKAYKLHIEFPDFFANMTKNMRDDTMEETITTLTQIIDSSFEFLVGSLEKSSHAIDLKKRLRETLTRDKFSDEERSKIISDACRVNLTDKLINVVKEALNLLGISGSTKRIEHLFDKAKTVRNKKSHGTFYQYFTNNPISFDDLDFVGKLLEHSIYVLFLRAIGIDSEQICEAFREKTLHILGKYLLVEPRQS